MDKDRLDDFGAYQKANELFELVADDMISLARNPLCVRLIGQPIAAADSIAANIDEGYGRGSKKEFARFPSHRPRQRRRSPRLLYSNEAPVRPSRYRSALLPCL